MDAIEVNAGAGAAAAAAAAPAAAAVARVDGDVGGQKRGRADDAAAAVGAGAGRKAPRVGDSDAAGVKPEARDDDAVFVDAQPSVPAVGDVANGHAPGAPPVAAPDVAGDGDGVDAPAVAPVVLDGAGGAGAAADGLGGAAANDGDALVTAVVVRSSADGDAPTVTLPLTSVSPFPRGKLLEGQRKSTLPGLAAVLPASFKGRTKQEVRAWAAARPLVACVVLYRRGADDAVAHLECLFDAEAK